MSKKIIIGFTGKKQSGKSESCKHILRKKEFKNSTVKINFKDALVEEIKQLFPDLLSKIAGIYSMRIDGLFEIKPPLMRALMQNFGTEVRRAQDFEYWVKQWEHAIASTDASYILVDDVRFLNEAEAIRKQGGIIVRINRPGHKTEDLHSSEVQMDLIRADITISTSEIADLQRELDIMLVNAIPLQS